jgi:hypothetical protein
MTARATTKQIALDLGLTERRVRQLVEEHVLARAEDGFDRDLCRYRYRLFSRGADADWRQAHDRALELAEEAEQLIALAVGPSASLVDIACACQTTQALWSHMRFLAAVQSASQSERRLFFDMWFREEAGILSSLLGRAEELARPPPRSSNAAK